MSISVLSIILLRDVVLLPFTHCSLFRVGASEQQVPSLEEVVLDVAACCVQLFCVPIPSKWVQKVLSTTFRELPELQGPLKPELFQNVVPEPCRPTSTTMSVSLTPDRPAPSPSITVVGWLVSEEGRVQLARPSGKLASTSSAEVPAGLSPLPQMKEGVELEKGAELLPALIAQARALDSTKAQQSLLDRQVERVEQLLPLLEKATSANSATKLNPLLSELVRLREPSHPPMQSWKAVLRSFLMGGTEEVVVNQVASTMSSRSSIMAGVISGVEWWTDRSLADARSSRAESSSAHFMIDLELIQYENWWVQYGTYLGECVGLNLPTVA